MIAVSLILTMGIASQVGGATAPPASCADRAAALRHAVEADYIGFRLATENEPLRGAMFVQFGQELVERAQTRSPSQCYYLMRDYLERFDDPHLFLADNPHVAGAQFERTAPVDVRARALASSRPGSLTGIWWDGAREIAVVAEGEQQFAAYESSFPHSVVAVFTSAPDGFEATLRYGPNGATRHRARLQKDALLHMPPHTWARRRSLDGDNVPVQAAPRAPEFTRIDDATVLLSVPSFSPEHHDALQALLARHDSEVQAASLLIVDIRGNEGGSSYVSDLLAPYYSDGRSSPAPSDRRNAVVLASDRQTEHYRRLVETLPDGEYREFLQRLIDRMSAHPGKLVRYGVDERDWRLMEPPPQHGKADGPANFAILADRHVVSAGEAFLLSAKDSAKVTIFGRSTAGSIDYESVYMTEVAGPGYRIALGMPSVAASDRLPAGGFNTSGVPVDVVLDPDDPQAIARIVEHYARTGDRTDQLLTTNTRSRALK
jgi:hypothetical protein